jgi:hypothetical protein
MLNLKLEFVRAKIFRIFPSVMRSSDDHHETTTATVTITLHLSFFLSKSKESDPLSSLYCDHTILHYIIS